MGWWKPYFFVDVAGVQVLFSGARIGSSAASLAAAVLGIALLCLFDRLAAAQAAALRGGGREKENAAVGWWAAQRLSGGLVMLVMMTFNVVLFGTTIACLAAAELAVVKTFRPGVHQFRAVPTADDDGVENARL
eukprot:SAG22_NODE_795_length_7149_cov_16.608227_5_plen_134_part_00